MGLAFDFTRSVLWLFGGGSYMNGVQTEVLTNDLWMFDPSTFKWFWMAGSPNTANGAGNYGSLMVPAVTNVPGARRAASLAADSLGNLFLYGGSGFAVNGLGALGDMWRLSAEQQWVWVSCLCFPTFSSNIHQTSL